MQIHAAMLALHTGPAGEDRLQPRGVLRRPHPPSPGADVVPSTGRPGTAGSSTCGCGSCSTAAPTRRARPPCARTPPRSPSGPYRVDNALIESTAVYTNNPPCGAMRGFGAVQTCFAAEAQMDLLAGELEIDPVELRLLNAIGPGDALPTGQVIDGVVPGRRGDPRRGGDSRARRRGAAARPDPAARRRGQHDARRGGATRRRLRGRLQEHLLLGGLRRLLRGPRAARTPTAAPTCTARLPRSARASSASSSRSRAPSSAPTPSR